MLGRRPDHLRPTRPPCRRCILEELLGSALRFARDRSFDVAAAFGRHIDKETGVAPWFKTFEVKYEFVYAGTGKKGGY